MGASKRKKKRKNNLQKFIIKHKKGTMITTVAGLLAIVLTVFQVRSYIKADMDLQIELLESKMDYSSTTETLLFDVNNRSEDDKSINKAVLEVLNYRDEEYIDMKAGCVLNENGVSVIVYNSGWKNASEVSFTLHSESEFFKNCRYPEKFEKSFSIIEYGQAYKLCELTVDDLYDKTNVKSIVIDCFIKEENRTVELQCYYMYEAINDRLGIGGKGDAIIPFEGYCCIEGANGTAEYEIPVNYSYEKHGTDQIKIRITADKSCSVRYVVIFYSGKKKVHKTLPKGTTFSISSYTLPYSE